ncbi:hypothetical protein [Dyadobacter luticola]|uniref:DUF5723 domain-containing protein n=1 Tax=Dyadobacter luticola TaxID=1979387 RepID=A0A5R9KZK3_9BACT|nr:hypothetical protein [Dyadobacter luticola]TLV01529.1 hypothetical protein FEN17_19075 [Dyadobacter luticola]
MTAAIQFRLLIVLLFLSVASAYGQDGTHITFSEEQDTSAVSQRFIDQYEAVFMTKIPTRHMFKYGSAISPVNGIFLRPGRIGVLTAEAGYEFKVTPAFSLGANFNITNKTPGNPQSLNTYAANVQARWYFDMNKRIRAGKNANNFSGNFLAFSWNNSVRQATEVLSLRSVGLLFGVQRRLFNDGRIEFTVGLDYQKYQNNYFLNEPGLALQEVKDVALSTHISLGGAFGDWKRTSNPPFCEILRCDEELNQQWKIQWPGIYLSSKIKKANLAFGYERKIEESPLSVNVQVNVDYRNNHLLPTTVYPTFKDRVSQVQPSLEIRYYFLQKYMARRGLGGNNLSGIYVGPLAEYINFDSELGLEKAFFKHLGAGAVLGFQKTLFRRVYFDIYGSWSWNTLKTGPTAKSGQGTVRLGLGWAI